MVFLCVSEKKPFIPQGERAYCSLTRIIKIMSSSETRLARFASRLLQAWEDTAHLYLRARHHPEPRSCI